MTLSIFTIFAAITVLFFLLLIAKSFLKWRFCVLCLSIGIVWAVSLVLYWVGVVEGILLIGVLVGCSVVGVYYLVEKKTKEDLSVFRLPFFLTLLLAGYLLLGLKTDLWAAILLLAILWILFGAGYFYRKNPRFKKAVEQIIACCRDW